MKFQLRLLPLLLTVLVSSVVLFGGWFAYNSMALKTPLSNIILDIEGVEQVHTEIDRNQVTVELTLTEDASLREIVQEIKAAGSSVIDGRELIISVSNASSAALNKWWSSALFDVAQAMETRKYSDIPRTLEALKADLSGLQTASEMDEEYVYIRLVHNDHSKFIMLPRTPVQLGVWE
jgi:hypothetical protein